MRGEHRMRWFEDDAFTGWRHCYNWRPGVRKAIKRMSHKLDRRKAKREVSKNLVE